MVWCSVWCILKKKFEQLSTIRLRTFSRMFANHHQSAAASIAPALGDNSSSCSGNKHATTTQNAVCSVWYFFFWKVVWECDCNNNSNTVGVECWGIDTRVIRSSMITCLLTAATIAVDCSLSLSDWSLLTTVTTDALYRFKMLFYL